MKVEIREHEVELIAETEHERDALARIRRHGIARVESSGHTWESDPCWANLVIQLNDPNSWGN